MPHSIPETLFRTKATLILITTDILFYSVANKNSDHLNVQFIQDYAYQWDHLLANGFSLKSIQMLVIPSLLHWNLTHLITNLSFLLIFVSFLELLAGSAVVSVAYLFGILFSNPLTTMVISPFIYIYSSQAARDFGQIMDVGSSLGIFSCLGVLFYLFRYSKTLIAITAIGVVIASYIQQDLLSLNHITAMAIGLVLAHYFIPKESI